MCRDTRSSASRDVGLDLRDRPVHDASLRGRERRYELLQLVLGAVSVRSRRGGRSDGWLTPSLLVGDHPRRCCLTRPGHCRRWSRRSSWSPPRCCSRRRRCWRRLGSPAGPGERVWRPRRGRKASREAHQSASRPHALLPVRLRPTRTTCWRADSRNSTLRRAALFLALLNFGASLAAGNRGLRGFQYHSHDRTTA